MGEVPGEALRDFEKVYLQKLLLATDVLLRASEEDDSVGTAALESELWAYRDRLELALLGR